MTRGHASDAGRGRLFVALAAIAWSSAGLLQRELHVGVATQVAGRAFFALIALLVYVAARQRGRVVHSFRVIGWAGVAIAALMAISSGSFIVALNHTSVANVLFMQALAPILAAFLARTLGEPTPRRTWLTMAVALAGVTVMVGGPGRPNALGLGLSFLVSASFAGILVITRHRRDVSMAPATCLSQAIVLLVAGPFSSPGSVGARDVVFFVLIGVGQIGLGFVFLTVGARLIPAAEVALITLLEVVLGPLWVWIVLSEQPGTATLVGGAIVLIAVAFQARPYEIAGEPARGAPGIR